jgi:large subunit ribosomal protein L24
MKIIKGDQVKVMAGKDRGKIGKVLRVLPEKNQILVEGVNLIYRHSRPTQRNPKGGIIEKEGPIHISNVMYYSGDGPTRVGFRTIEDKEKKTKKKVRISVKTGEMI